MEDQLNPENNEEKNFVPGEGVERQQTSEEILFALEEAVKSQETIKIIFRNPEGGLKKIWGVPSLFKEGFLWITKENGEPLQINISQIEKVEQKKDQDAPLNTTPPETPLDTTPQETKEVE